MLRCESSVTEVFAHKELVFASPVVLDRLSVLNSAKRAGERGACGEY